MTYSQLLVYLLQLNGDQLKQQVTIKSVENDITNHVNHFHFTDKYSEKPFISF